MAAAKVHTSGPPAAKKVLVIGAGVAGLTAGHLLKEQGTEFQILEASSRWGGRIKDADGFADFPIALGAEWVHSPQVFKAGDLYGCFACFFSDMVLHTADCPIFQDVTAGKSTDHAIFPDLVEDLNILQNGKVQPVSAQVKKFFNVDGDNKFHSSSWVNVFDKRVVPGIRDHIVFNSPVTEINYQKDKVTVKTEAGTMYEADKVLVCVPVSILKQDRITFIPAQPPEKVAAIKKTKLTPGLKVFIEFKEKFYPHFLLMQSMDSSGYYMYMDETVGKNSDKHILCLVVLGVEIYQRVTAKGSDDESIKQFVLNELDQIFDGKASANFIKSVIQNWAKEPFIEFGGPDTHDKDFDAKALAAPLDGKVFFAGDAMNPNSENNLYVQGACETAYIAVKAMACEGNGPVCTVTPANQSVLST